MRANLNLSRPNVYFGKRPQDIDAKNTYNSDKLKEIRNYDGKQVSHDVERLVRNGASVDEIEKHIKNCRW